MGGGFDARGQAVELLRDGHGLPFDGDPCGTRLVGSVRGGQVGYRPGAGAGGGARKGNEIAVHRSPPLATLGRFDVDGPGSAGGRDGTAGCVHGCASGVVTNRDVDTGSPGIGHPKVDRAERIRPGTAAFGCRVPVIAWSFRMHVQQQCLLARGGCHRLDGVFVVNQHAAENLGGVAGQVRVPAERLTVLHPKPLIAAG